MRDYNNPIENMKRALKDDILIPLQKSTLYQKFWIATIITIFGYAAYWHWITWDISLDYRIYLMQNNQFLHVLYNTSYFFLTIFSIIIGAFLFYVIAIYTLHYTKKFFTFIENMDKKN